MNELVGLLPYAAPVAFAALGESIGELAGVVNIGLEGTMLAAAYGAMLGATLRGGGEGLALGFAFAVLLGVAFALGSALFTVVLGIDAVVVGTAVNLFALGLTGTLFRARYGRSGTLLSLPTLPMRHGLDVALVALLLAGPALWALMRWTRWGLAARAAGDFPAGLEAVGLDPIRVRLQACAAAGAFAGLGGAYLVLGTTGSFAENMTNGRGFVAIALVTFGRWRAPWIVAAALFIGALDGLQYRLQAAGDHIPREALLALPYATALLFLALAGTRARAPGALGTAYRRQR